MKIIFSFIFVTLSASLWANDLPSLEKACIGFDGLSCAKAAYQYRRAGDLEKAHKFYKMGCELKDETACHNMAALDPRDIYFKKVDSIFKFNSTNITNCYQPKTAAVIESGLKERWYKSHITIHINKQGMADVVNLNTNLPNDYQQCVKKLLKSLQFPKPENIDPTYTYELTIASKE